MRVPMPTLKLRRLRTIALEVFKKLHKESLVYLHVLKITIILLGTQEWPRYHR